MNFNIIYKFITIKTLLFANIKKIERMFCLEKNYIV